MVNGISKSTLKQAVAVPGVANGTSKNVGLGKVWQDLEILEAFLISLEVSFFHGLFLLFLSLETFHQRVSGSDFWLGSRRLSESRILPFATPSADQNNYYID